MLKCPAHFSDCSPRKPKLSLFTIKVMIVMVIDIISRCSNVLLFDFTMFWCPAHFCDWPPRMPASTDSKGEEDGWTADTHRPLRIFIILVFQNIDETIFDTHIPPSPPRVYLPKFSAYSLTSHEKVWENLKKHKWMWSQAFIQSWYATIYCHWSP